MADTITTNDLLIEIGCEELPPLALSALSSALGDNLAKGLRDANLAFTARQDFASPRRLAVLFSALEDRQADQTVEKLGPAVSSAVDADGKPTKAAAGFAKSCGVAFDALQSKNTDKGERLCFSAHQAGQALAELLPAILQTAVAALPIPKRMRWGAKRQEFIRPVHWLVTLYGSKVLATELFDIKSSNTSRGHRFHGPSELVLTTASGYEKQLKDDAHVIASMAERRRLIETQIAALASQHKGEAVVGKDLLDEVASLVEWPHALLGNFDTGFLALPGEALISSMRSHQKYFHVVDTSGELLPHFITVANIDSKDAAQVVAGNERVIRPRLADAAFFYQQDQKQTLLARRAGLSSLVFQKQLGSVLEKTQRIAELGAFIASQLNYDAAQARRAGELCKVDLLTDMVGEFADLQGTIGRYYAVNDGEAPAVSEALEQHYWPRQAGDALPQNPTAWTIALADRLDTLVGIFGIGQAPTGSKDPFALRRAALGVVRLCIENKVSVDLRQCLQQAKSLYKDLPEADVEAEVLFYVIERLRAYYVEQGIAVEVYLAVRERLITDLVDFDRRIHAVNSFMHGGTGGEANPNAVALAAANKRVANILAKQKNPVDALPVKNLLVEDSEHQLFELLQDKENLLAPVLQAHDYNAALTLLATLKEPVDHFFDNVMVMVDDPELQKNRIALLSQLRNLFLGIADISRLAPK